MSEQSIIFQYQTGIVTGGYSFSAHNNVITLSGYVETLDDDRVREAIQYEAERARALYIEEINRLRTIGVKVSAFLIKTNASKTAKDEARVRYSDVWGVVENAHKKAICAMSTAATVDTQDKTDPCNPQKSCVAILSPDNRLAEALTPKEAANMIENLPFGYKVRLCVLSPYNLC